VKVTYHLLDVADCTSDPHIVSYDDSGVLKERLAAMLDDIVRVCESEHVSHVRVVSGVVGDTQYASDSYGQGDFSVSSKKGKKREPITTDEARMHKIHGLYWWSEPSYSYVTSDEDSPVRFTRHLPPGLTGLKRLVEKAKKAPDKFMGLQVGVIWTFAGSHSCSDYIEVGLWLDSMNAEDIVSVNYGSQDWWINEPGYNEWCKVMEEFLGRYFPCAND
jgi:hypothetical protein